VTFRMNARVFSFALCLMILAGCGERTRSEGKHDYYAESYGLVAEVCSNVVGFRRIMQSHTIFVDTHNSAYPSNWTADADVEFINKVGGVEVTNVPILFICLDSGKLCAAVDYRVIVERQEKEFRARMDSLQAQTKKIEEVKFEPAPDPEPKRKLTAIQIQNGQSYTWTYKAGGKVTGVLYALHGETFVVTSPAGQRLIIRTDLLIDEDQKIADKLTHVP